MQEPDTLRVAILGPLEVRREPGDRIEVPGRRLRALLIRLALEPRRPVSAQRLIDDLWREEPPAAAANALQALVSRLRAALGRTTIESGGGGYRLNLPAEAVDAIRFERLVREAGESTGPHENPDDGPALAARGLREALGLWRGDALADVEGEPFAEAARAKLEELRVTAVERLVDAVLEGGTAAEAAGLVPELERLRATYPWREGLHGRYMRVLYALGRHAEALAAYERLRRALADELGADPSPETARLHLAMLRQDPELRSFGRPGKAAGAGGTAALPATPPSGTRPQAAGAADAAARAASAHDASAASPANPSLDVGIDRIDVGAGVGSGEPPGRSAARPSGPAQDAPAASAGLWSATVGEAAVPAAVHRRGNLPAQLTSFIGRERELEQVTGLLRRARLVTLTGPGGAGKTRLAQECGVRLAGLAPDGVWFVPLASVAAGADVAQAVLTALGGDELWPTAIALEGLPVTAAQRLPAILSGRRPLLILDNCEHVVDDVADLVDRVLAAAPGVRVLATSREPLALTGETLCPVSSLELPPEPGEPPAAGLTAAAPPAADGKPGANGTAAATGTPAEDGSPDRLTDGTSAAEAALGYASVRLFAERARAVRPSFVLTEAGVAPVTRICRALDGIPLAIELAAARLRSLTAQQVADRLDDRFRLLSSGSRTALPRHQTLRAIVDWSWELLGPAERGVLARLSVFAGGATPEAAAQVCAEHGGGERHGDGVSGPAGVIEVIDVIASLVDKSLVAAREDEAGDVRYRLLETVRVYAAERLEECGGTRPARDAHASHFLAVAQRADPLLRGPRQVETITRLDLERDNLNAALRHFVLTEDISGALRMFQDLVWFWMVRGREGDVTQWAEEVGKLAERTGAPLPEELNEAHLMCQAARRLMQTLAQGEADAYTLAASLLEALPPETVYARHPLLAIGRPTAGILARRDADVAGMRAELAALGEHPEPWIRAMRHGYLGLLELHQGRPAEAEAALRTAYAEHSNSGDRLGLMFILVLLGELALVRGRFDEAVRHAEEAYGYASEGLSDDSGSGMLVRVGQARALAGQVEAGRRLMEQAAATAEGLGEYSEAAVGHSELAALALRLGDRAEARRRLARAMELNERAGRAQSGLNSSAILARRGYLAALDGEYDQARELLRAAVDVVRGGPLLTFMAGLDEAVRGLAAVAGMQGDHVHAAELLGSAYAATGMDNAASYADPPTRAAARAALGEAAFLAAYERGRRLGRAEMLALEP